MFKQKPSSCTMTVNDRQRDAYKTIEGRRDSHLESGGEERSSESETEEGNHVETELGSVGLV